ncbi:RHS repeat domain-containing protein [Lampropedia aestuarii]|nr:RHS repeat domain-containing protein [Lampropedia aestuarii]
MEHQLQAAIVTRSGNTDAPSTQRFTYQYDAFGRRIAKTDAFGHTLFA